MSADEVIGAALKVAQTVYKTVSEHPMVAVPLLIVTVIVLVLISPAGGASASRDGRRVFTTQERRRAFERAGWRCEHKNPLWMRCSNSASQGDHIYPWSKGGRTAMSNHQALCAYHNNRKSGSVPSRLYIIRLEMRRRSYFPSGESVHVEWREGAAR